MLRRRLQMHHRRTRRHPLHKLPRLHHRRGRSRLRPHSRLKLGHLRPRSLKPCSLMPRSAPPLCKLARQKRRPQDQPNVLQGSTREQTGLRRRLRKA